MKKIFFAFAAMAALLTSCSKDDAPINVPFGDEQIVSFEVSSPELTTRYGEGTTATVLEWWVYEDSFRESSLIPTLNGRLDNYDGNENISIKLIQGRSYHILFWAHAPGVSDTVTRPSGNGSSTAVYHVNPTDATMNVDYTKMKANQESYDAFYNYYDIGVVTSASQGGTVELTRPFAQLNVATSDTADALKADLDVKYTGIIVSDICTTLNFSDGSVSNPQSVNFDITEKATGVFSHNDVNYDIISMNYLLVKDKTLVKLNLKLQEYTTAGAEVLTRDYSQISVQRNHRTYILGDIYTQPAQFNVIIKEDFVGNFYEDEN